MMFKGVLTTVMGLKRSGVSDIDAQLPPVIELGARLGAVVDVD